METFIYQVYTYEDVWSEEEARFIREITGEQFYLNEEKAVRCYRNTKECQRLLGKRFPNVELECKHIVA